MAECGRAMIKTSWKKANEDDEKDDYSSITPTGFKQQNITQTLFQEDIYIIDVI